MRLFLIITLTLALNAPATIAHADVELAVGPTSIPRGDALGARDITVSNEIFAVAFAVDTAPPWGVARGGIVDIAPVHAGVVGYDIASLADFLPNSWSSWPTTYQNVTIEKQSAQEVVIKVVRDWEAVKLETIFTIRDSDSRIHVVTMMTNNGETPLTDLKSGYIAWPDGGSLFGIPGLFGLNSAAEDAAFADWSAAYGEQWAVGLHAPFAKLMEYDGRDRYVQHSLPAGEARSFEAWLQIENTGSLAPMVRTEIKLREMASGRVNGTVSNTDGKAIARPAVIVSKDGQPYAWAIGEKGRYVLDLPTGKYAIYATAKGHAQGATRTITVTSDSKQRQDFADVEAPGAVSFAVAEAISGDALDARIDIRSGPKPLIGYFGRSALFTELDSVGKITTAIAPGEYVFEISAGGGFTSVPQVVESTVKSGETRSLKVTIATLASPQSRDWYSADLHHHSDVLDGFTEAEYVLRSELASGVDITFLSDHDSVVNNAKMQELSARREVLFMAGTEMSPSWAHFNAFPLDDGKQIDIDPGQSTVQEIFAAARRMGADVIEANHPFMGYGYFSSEAKGEIPGGYDAGFELVEIEAGIHAGAAERNRKTIEHVWQMWNDGVKVYLAAGSDAHDVWQEPSGAARTYVHVHGDLSIEKYIVGLKAGRAFASQGPLVYPKIMFGSKLTHRQGDNLALKYSVQAVSGLRSVQLIAAGIEAEVSEFDGSADLNAVEFRVSPDSDTWYSLIVEDMQGRYAYTNPIWVLVAD